MKKWPDKKPKSIAGDKGYDFGRMHLWLKTHHIQDVIAQMRGPRKHRPAYFPKRVYRRRNVIERCVGKLKEQRSIATRFEKLAKTFAGEIWLCVLKEYLSILAKEELVNTA